MEQLCDREGDRYGRIFRNLITLYVVRTKHGSETDRKPADLGIAAQQRIAEFASLLRANP